MPKYLFSFLLFLSLVTACFKVPKDDAGGIKGPDLPANGGDGLTDEQLKNAFALSVKGNWYREDENTLEETLINVNPQDGSEYLSPKQIDTFLGSNNNLPDDPIIGVTYNETPASDDTYKSPIIIEYVQVKVPNGDTKTIYIKNNTVGEYSAFLHLGSNPKTKGLYTFFAFAKRTGNKGTLTYNLPPIKIYVTRNTDEYYYATNAQAYKDNFELVPKNKSFYYKLNSGADEISQDNMTGVNVPIEFGSSPSERNNIKGYWWFGNKAISPIFASVYFTLELKNLAWKEVKFMFDIYGQDIAKRNKVVKVQKTFLNTVAGQKVPAFPISAQEDPNCPESTCNTYMSNINFQLNNIEAFDGKHYLRINNIQDTENPFVYRYSLYLL